MLVRTRGYMGTLWNQWSVYDEDIPREYHIGDTLVVGSASGWLTRRIAGATEGMISCDKKMGCNMM